MDYNTEEFIRKNGCNPAFWLNALETATYCTDCREKQQTLQNAHDKLKIFIDFLLKSQ
jgi:hypothetical protein